MTNKNLIQLHYPKAINWMWDYCTYLGPFTDSNGDNYDLGFVKSTTGLSAAIVHGNNPGNYFSGNLSMFGYDNDIADEKYKEVRARLKSLGININHLKQTYNG